MNIPNNLYARWLMFFLGWFLFYAVFILLLAGVKDQFEADINTADLWELSVLMSLIFGFVNAYNYEPTRPKEKNNFWKHHDEYGSTNKQEHSKKAGHSTEQQRNTEANLIKGLIEEAPNTPDSLTPLKLERLRRMKLSSSVQARIKRAEIIGRLIEERQKQPSQSQKLPRVKTLNSPEEQGSTKSQRSSYKTDEQKPKSVKE